MPSRTCPGCQVELDIPAGAPAGKKVRCPECDHSFILPGPKPTPPTTPLKPKSPPPAARKPVQVTEVIEDEAPPPKPRKKSTPATEVVDDETPRPRKKKKKKTHAEDLPFWKTRLGMTLNGLGLVALGVAAVAIAYFGEPRKPIVFYLGGAVCVVAGIGSVSSGALGLTDDTRDDDDA